MTETWIPIPGYEGLYAVSSLGRVRSAHGRTGLISTAATDKDGYPIVALTKAGKRHTYVLHRLVCRAFHGEQPNALHKEVAHLDGKRSNVNADNLKWSGKVENHFHKRRHGTHQAGEKHPLAKISASDVRAIRARAASGETGAALGREFGIGPSQATAIIRGERWKQIAPLGESPVGEAETPNHPVAPHNG